VTEFLDLERYGPEFEQFIAKASALLSVAPRAVDPCRG